MKTRGFLAAVVCLLAIGTLMTPVAAQRRGSFGTEPRQPLTSAQMDEISRRIATVNAILSRVESDAKARGLADGWRQATMESLLTLNGDALEQVAARASSLDVLAAAASDAVEDPDLIGDPDADLTYTPISPCRFVDTRNYAAGKISGTRGFDIVLNGASYGGSAGCDPTALFGVGENGFGALAMNITVVDTSTAGSPGFAAAKPTAAAPTTSILNWFTSSVATQVANAAIVTTDQTLLTDEFVIQTSGAVHVIVDIFGAFIRPEATPLEVFTIDGTTQAVAAGANQNLPAATCPAATTAVGGGIDVSSFDIVMIESRPSASNGWACAVRSIGGAGNANCTVTCARVPGR